MKASFHDKGRRPEAPPLQERGLGWGLSEMSDALSRHAELVSASSLSPPRRATSWTLKQVQGDEVQLAPEARMPLHIGLDGSVG
jgi:hypothetical protein